MSQSPFRPLRLFVNLDQEIEKALATLIHRPWGRQDVPGGWQPAVDLYETDDARTSWKPTCLACRATNLNYECKTGELSCGDTVGRFV